MSGETVFSTAGFRRAAIAYKGCSEKSGAGVGDKVLAYPVAVYLFAGSAFASTKPGSRAYLLKRAVLLETAVIDRAS